MGQLADRYAALLAEHGFDPAARQGEVQSLAALEADDEPAAQDRFHALKRQLILERRALLLSELGRKPFVRGLPPRETAGYSMRDLEIELRALGKAAATAREVEDALADEAARRAEVRARALPPADALPPTPWEDLAPLAERAEALRRVVAREARIEARARAAAQRARKLKRPRVDAPDPATTTDDALATCEAALSDAEALEGAHAEAIAPLRDAAVGEWRAPSKRKLEREADALLDARDLAGLAALRARSEALRREAAAVGAEAARARRSGRAPPPRERKPGDPMDPYA